MLHLNTYGGSWACWLPLAPFQDLLQACTRQTLQVQTGYTVLLHVRAEASNNQGFFFFFFGEMIKPGGGDRTSCKKPHPEQASPRLTVNKYSLLAALPSTVRALAPIAFQVQTGKGRKESEMADRRFNLLLAAVFTGGALLIQQDCQLPGIAPGPHFFLLTFIIVLLQASPQLAYPMLRSEAPSLDQISSQNQTGRLQTERQLTSVRDALYMPLL